MLSNYGLQFVQNQLARDASHSRPGMSYAFATLLDATF